MAKKVVDLRKAYPQLAPDRDYPPLRLRSLKGKVSPAEWEARIPGTEAFLLNPFGLMYEEICASALIKVNLAGEVRRPYGLLEWPAMRRLADRVDPSYKN